jgi:DNA polymerase-1
MWLQTLRDWQVWSQDVSWGRVGFDTETNGLDWNTLEIWGASFADGRNSCYINLLDNPEKPEILAAIWDRLLTVKTLIGHNLAFDLKVLLKTYGEKANQWMMGVTLVDTYCADFLLDERVKHSLKGPGGCLDRHLGRNAMEFTQADKAGPKSRVFASYAEADAVNTLDLWNTIRPKLLAEGLGGVFNLECRFIPALVEMESSGIFCDRDLLIHIGNELNSRMYELLGKIDMVFQDELRQDDGCLFNVDSAEDIFNSPAKTMQFLNGKLGFSVINADAETMEACVAKDERLKFIMEYHKVHKLLSTYIDGIEKYIGPDGRVRPSYRTVSTGRLSCSSPNVQNQPKATEDVAGIDVRSVWRPAAGNKYLRADYSQFQLRIAAHNAKDDNMLRAFAEGYDVHMLVANKGKQLGIPDEDLKETSPKFKEIKKQYEAVRTQFKAANFGLLFERSANNLAKDWKTTKQEAQAVIDSVFTMFPRLKAHKDKWHEFIRNKGYSMTMFGRRRRFARPVSESDLRAGWNSTIQGSEADIIKVAMRNVWELLHRRSLATRLIWQIHDEIILEGPEEELESIRKEVEALLCGAVALACPVSVDSNIVGSYSEK